MPFTRFTDFEGSENDAAISRDGRFVVFRSDRDGPVDTWVSQVGSGRFVNLTKGTRSSVLVRNAGFTSDGSEIWLSAILGGDQKSNAAAESRAAETEKNLAVQQALLEDAKAKLLETFKSLAAEALSGSNKDFLILAEEKFKGLKEDIAGKLAQLVQPLHETLATYQRETKELQQQRGPRAGRRKRTVAGSG